eukprot:TRINITY_DN32290_c0_g1_i1.p3 TRINITY_DN32290_c0_g1~~TRINITY_DN32290_c0_g1_i1.p3  ORF type:complete len:208 (+),score=97.86 TRINITY_DN32290_c0_g1_i1:142-765(+)
MEKFKIVLLGEGRVGKTSLVKRYVLDEFSDSQKSTVQASMYSSKKVQVDDTTVTVSIWDTAGQERFRALGPIYYRDANGALVVYDITDADTFDKVKMWVRELRKMVGDDIRIVVAGNKADMMSKRTVDENMVLNYCAELDAEHIYTSAKNGSGVQDVFMTLTKGMLKTRHSGKSGKSGTKKGPSRTVRIQDDDDSPKRGREKGGCCK